MAKDDWIDTTDDWQEVPQVPVASEPSMLQKAGEAGLSGLAAVGSAIDRFTGAPVRSAVQAIGQGGGLSEAAQAYGKQFGEAPNLAPSGQELIEAAGVPRTSLSEALPGLYSESGEGLPLKKGGFFDPTLSGTLGVGADILTDPLTFLPVTKVAKGISKLVGPKITHGVSKVAEATTGIAAQDVKTYIKHLSEVDKMAKTYGGDIASAADELRKKFEQNIKVTRQGLNKNITDVLTGNVNHVDLEPVISRLSEAKSKINPKLYPEQIAEIDGIIEKVRGAAGDILTPEVKDAFEIQKFLQQTAKPAYGRGQIFQVGDKTQNAAKQAAAILRESVNEVAPEIAQANSQLAKMHEIERSLNKNILSQGKSEASLLSAGAGTHPGNVRNLEQLGQITGTPMLEEAQKLSAMRSFGSPGLIPVDVTGKSAARIMTTSGIGMLGGGLPGAVMGGLASSPAVLKKAIQTADIVKKAISGISEAVPKKVGIAGMEAARQSYKTPKQNIINADDINSKLERAGLEQKYAGAIQNAAQAGQAALATVHYLLGTQDSDYQRAMQNP